MKYIIYKITNLINNKIYIGKHQTKDVNDSYMGSGKLLRRAQQKHGIENFRKDILYVFDTEENMNRKEAEIVTEEFCLSDSNYNLCSGGMGGFSYINREILTPEVRTKHASIKKITLKNNSNCIASGKRNGSKNMKAAHLAGNIRYDNFRGKKHTDDTKAKMRKPKNQGCKNSQFGTMWITNGSINKKVKHVDLIPEGWHKGRSL